ncbi:MAG: Mth938-like domain-containing protein [Rickettsiaceae bacterium]|nr:Mth938-like domain-containing protein [Rickettsiaceae bacterium]
MRSKLPDLAVIDITPDVDENANIISSYSEKYITVKDQKYYGNIFITKNSVENFANIDDALRIMQKINELEFEKNYIIIFGCNSEEIINEIYISTMKFGINIESMNISAAIRTYNVLVQDGREIFAFFGLEAYFD